MLSVNKDITGRAVRQRTIELFLLENRDRNAQTTVDECQRCTYSFVVRLTVTSPEEHW